MLGWEKPMLHKVLVEPPKLRDLRNEVSKDMSYPNIGLYCLLVIHTNNWINIQQPVMDTIFTPVELTLKGDTKKKG